MLEIMIPRDIREFETKFIGPLTFRQTIAFTIAGLIGYLGAFIQRNIFLLDSVNYTVLIPFAVIPIAFGYGKKLLGMELEVYLQMVFINMFLTPKRRPYKTHNYYSTLVPKKEKEEESFFKKKEKPIPDLPAELVAYS